MKNIRIIILIAVLFGIIPNYANAQRSKGKDRSQKENKSKIAKESDDVEIVCYGEGNTLDEATKVALRSGIEQTYGTFVSSNTEFLNDEIVKDEISTVASGNIKEYEILSQTKTDDKWKVIIKTLISRRKLVSFVQSHGGKAELDGATFAANYKIEQFYKEAEQNAIANMFKQINELTPYLFDYEISVGEPSEYYFAYYGTSYGQRENKAKKKEDGHVYVPVTITCKINKNIEEYQSTFSNVMKALGTDKTSATGKLNIACVIWEGHLQVFDLEKGEPYLNPGAQFLCYLRNNISNQCREYDMKLLQYNGKMPYRIDDGLDRRYGVNWAAHSRRQEWVVDENTSLLVAPIPAGCVVWKVSGYLEYTIDEISKIKTITISSRH